MLRVFGLVADRYRVVQEPHRARQAWRIDEVTRGSPNYFELSMLEKLTLYQVVRAALHLRHMYTGIFGMLMRSKLSKSTIGEMTVFQPPKKMACHLSRPYVSTFHRVRPRSVHLEDLVIWTQE
jgi:hypothetical protein